MTRMLAALLSLATAASGADAPDLSLIYTADLRGRLWPMASEESQYLGDLGGVARLASLTARWRAGSQDALLVDTGGFTAPGAPSIDGYTLEALGAIGYDVLNCGASEAALSVDALLALAKRSKAPLISANLARAADGQPVLPRHVVVGRGERKVRVIGLVRGDIPPERLGAGLRVQAPGDALASCVAEVEGNSVPVVVLACMSPEAIYALARRYPRVTVFLGGAPATSAPVERVGGALIAYLGDEGRTVGSLDASFPAGRRPVATGRVVFLSRDIPSDKALAAIADACRKELGQRKHPGASTDLKMPATSMYVGSEVCRICHIKIYYTRQKTKHAGAYKTLVDRGRHENAACLTCHATGFRMPGGFDPAKAVPAPADGAGAAKEELAQRIERKSQQALAAVGCESCHGGSRRHLGSALRDRAATVTSPQLRTRSAVRNCLRCHTGGRPCLPKGQDDPFDLPRYLGKIKHWSDERDSVREF